MSRPFSSEAVVTMPRGLFMHQIDFWIAAQPVFHRPRFDLCFPETGVSGSRRIFPFKSLARRGSTPQLANANSSRASIARAPSTDFRGFALSFTPFMLTEKRVKAEGGYSNFIAEDAAERASKSGGDRRAFTCDDDLAALGRMCIAIIEEGDINGSTTSSAVFENCGRRQDTRARN